MNPENPMRGDQRIKTDMRDPLKVVEVVGTIDLATSGATYVVRRLAASLAALGVDVELAALGRAGREVEDGVVVSRFPHDLAAVAMVRKFHLSRKLDVHLATLARQGVILHTHGLWAMPNVYPAAHAHRHGCPLLLSPHGMLGAAALQFSPLKKKAFALLAQRRALRRVTCFHATSRQEFEEIRAYGLDAPVAIIPNGIELPDVGPAASRPDDRRTVLYLGRVHPKKGIDRLLDAWARVEAKHPRWQLAIVGPSEIGYGDALRRQAAGLRLQRVTFEDGLFDDARTEAYRAADLVVLPSLNENFGMVVAEALAVGTPVISTKGTPWSGLVDQRCGWWVDHGAEPLAATLVEAMATPRAVLAEMGARGRDWMARDYSWGHIALEMSAVYRWCKGQGERPSTVET